MQPGWRSPRWWTGANHIRRNWRQWAWGPTPRCSHHGSWNSSQRPSASIYRKPVYSKETMESPKRTSGMSYLCQCIWDASASGPEGWHLQSVETILTGCSNNPLGGKGIIPTTWRNYPNDVKKLSEQAKETISTNHILRSIGEQENASVGRNKIPILLISVDQTHP